MLQADAARAVLPPYAARAAQPPAQGRSPLPAVLAHMRDRAGLRGLSEPLRSRPAGE